MIAVNIVLMLAVVVSLVSLLAWAIVSDRRSYRAAGGESPPSDAPLHHNLVMPHELRAHRPSRGRAHAYRTPSRAHP
jgi:hypothetical protein